MVTRALLVALLCTAGHALAASTPLTSGDNQVVALAPAGPQLSLGPAEATVTVELMWHPASGGALLALLRRLQLQQPDVRLVLYVYNALMPGTDVVTLALYEARTQDRLGPFIDQLLMPGERPTSPESLAHAARAAGLDEARFAQALRERRHQAEIERAHAELQPPLRPPNEVRINARRHNVSSSEYALQGGLREARERALRLRELGVPPSRLFEALRAEERNLPLGILPRPRARRVPLDVAGAPWIGAALPRVTIALFCNLSWPSCAEMYSAARAVLAKYPNEVRLVWKEWVPSYSPENEARVALAMAQAGFEGRLWSLCDRWLAQPSPRPRLAGLIDALLRQTSVTSTPMDPPAPRGPAPPLPPAERLSRGARWVVDRDRNDAQQLGLNYNPGLWVNGLVFTQSLATALEPAVAEELERGLLERLTPPPGARR